MNGDVLVSHLESHRIGNWSVEISQRMVGPTFQAAIFGSKFDDLAFRKSRAKFRNDVVVVESADLPRLRSALPGLVRDFERSLTFYAGALERLGHPMTPAQVMEHLTQA